MKTEVCHKMQKMCKHFQLAIPACPNPMNFFNRGKMEGTSSLKIPCLVFVCVCFVSCEFVSGLILQIFENLWLEDWCAE